jgi:hypothetical protein
LPERGSNVSLATSPDNQWLVSSRGTNEQIELSIWRVADRSRIGSFTSRGTSCFKLAFSPDGSVLEVEDYRKCHFLDFPALLKSWSGVSH